MPRDIINRPDLAPAAALFAAACHQSRAWDSEMHVACKRYGGHGPAVSGCGRDHFPHSLKDSLRTLARDVATLSDAAYAARPPRIRLSTLRALSRAVAARDGSGFYGPQP